MFKPSQNREWLAVCRNHALTVAYASREDLENQIKSTPPLGANIEDAQFLLCLNASLDDVIQLIFSLYRQTSDIVTLQPNERSTLETVLLHSNNIAHRDKNEALSKVVDSLARTLRITLPLNPQQT